MTIGIVILNNRLRNYATSRLSAQEPLAVSLTKRPIAVNFRSDVRLSFFDLI